MQNFPRNHFSSQTNQTRSPNAYRRGPGSIVPPQTLQAPAAPTQHHLNQLQHEAIRRQDAGRRTAKKPTDRDIPDDISEAIVGDGVDRYKRLREVERRLDAAMMRKRLDVSDNAERRYTRKQGVLRIWVSNTAEGQPWQLMEEGNVDDDGLFGLEDNRASYRVKIEGRLLEDPEEDEEDKLPPSQRLRLSSFFKAITIDFDRDPGLQPDNFSQIEWRKPQQQQQQQQPNANSNSTSAEASFDTLEFSRKADENINITINLTPDETLERFRVDPELAKIIDTDEDDRAGVVQAIWEYCRAMGLPEDDDKRKIVCDDALRKVFKQDQLYFPFIADQLTPLLHPLPPTQLQYTIRVDKAYIAGTKDAESSEPEDTTETLVPSRPTIYDVRVPLPNNITHKMRHINASQAHINDLRAMVRTDDDLALLVQKIHQTNAKRKFYDNLAKDPASFIKRWVSSQQRDFEIILAEATRGGGEDATTEEFRKGGADGVWGTEMARESVGLWLARTQKAH